MLNYMKSEHYRLLRKKSLYIIPIASYALIIFAALVLAMYGKYDADFLYNNNAFFYSTLLGSGMLILVIAVLFNLMLTGKDSLVIKHAVAYDIPKTTIYWVKLILPMLYFFLISLIGISLMIGLGELLLESNLETVPLFLIAVTNIIPIVLSCFVLVHTMKLLGLSDVYVFISLIFVYGFSGNILRGINTLLKTSTPLHEYMPSSQLGKNLILFMSGDVQIDGKTFLTAAVLIGLSLWIGLTKFKNKEFN